MQRLHAPLPPVRRAARALMPGWSRSGLMSVLFTPASFSPAL